MDGGLFFVPMDYHLHDWSVAAKWFFGGVFGHGWLSGSQLSSLSILRRSSTWFVRTLTFSRCSTNYSKGLRVQLALAFQKSTSPDESSQKGPSRMSESPVFVAETLACFRVGDSVVGASSVERFRFPALDADAVIPLVGRGVPFFVALA